MTGAELFGYDYSIFAESPDVTTTTEGMGIPGTGDPFSTYPAGVFFANPAFNDVTNIRYAHDSNFRGGAISFGQKSYYDSHNCYVGVGVGYNRLRTTDILTGTVDGFDTDFRYETDVATRGTNLFVRGGVEIPLDNFWDEQLRYAGEFSGFRLSAGGEGRVNFLDAEGLDQLDLTGFVSDSQAVRIGKDDTTFSYKLNAGLNYAPTGIKGLDISLGVEYGESDTHPVAHRSGQTGETTRIEFEQEEVFVGTLGTRFRF
jgi:opacity protein-like surface antigen